MSASTGGVGVGGYPFESQRHLVSTLATYFYELSNAYESCLLGQHYAYYQPTADNPESAFIPVHCASPRRGRQIGPNLSMLRAYPSLPLFNNIMQRSVFHKECNLF